MTTVRLSHKLISAGMTEDEVEKLDRQGLMNAWAEMVATGKDKPLVTPATVTGYDPSLERERLAFEKMKFEEEKAERKRREDMEAKKLEEEKAEKRRREDLEAKKLELELRREEIEAKRLEEEKDDRLRREEEEKADRLRREEEEKADRLRREEIEAKRLEEEKADRLRREEIENRRMEAERAERRRQLDQLELQNDLKRKELALQEERDRREADGRNSMVARIKRVGDAMKNAISRMPNDPMELVSFFENLERLFETFEVADDLKANLLRPYLNDRARNLLARFDPTRTADYERVKQYLLHEFHLSPQVYLEKFNNSVRGTDDTYVLFCAKLKALLEYYLKSRKIEVSKDPSYQRLISLLICDRIKSSLPDHVLRHILAIESNRPEGWLPHNDLAEAIDLYMSNHWHDGKPKGGAIGTQTSARNSWKQNAQSGAAINSRQNTSNQLTNSGMTNVRSNNAGPKLCHNCSSPQHLVANCPLKQVTPVTPAQTHAGRGQTGYNRVNRTGRVNVTQGTVNTVALDANSQTANNQTAASPVNNNVTHANQTSASVNEVMANDIHVRDMYDEFIDVLCGETHTRETMISEPVDVTSVKSIDQNDTGYVVHQSIVFNNESPADIEFAHLHRIEINIQGVHKSVKGLEDSGAQICVIRSDIVKDVDVERVGTVKLRGIFGPPLQTDLIRLQIRLADKDDASFVSVICAMCDDIYEELILNADVVNHLHQRDNDTAIVTADVMINETADVNDADVSNSETILPVTNDVNNDVSKVDDTMNDDQLQMRRANAETLKAEQLADDTLSNCWTLARANKGDYFIYDGLLYHRDNILGQPVSQLCLPLKRRAEVLKLAHDIHGGHLSFRKSRDRLRLTFYWPTLKTDLLRHLQRCFECQTRARVTYRDRVPITPIPRAQTPFTHWVMDCFGPILGNQKIEYPYCLLLCCSATRFPWAHPLRSLTAKSVCDALLELFSFTGVASQCVISSDQGSNFTAQLTREFMKRLGVSPRFNTPGHPQASGLCERLVQSTKNIVSKLARNSPSSWHKYVNCAMWALREVPNETTGVAPFMLVFGHLPKGPLAILKEHWSGETDLPLDFGKSTTEYLADLRDKLETAQSYATSHTQRAQNRYANHYNLRSKDKCSDVGDQVLILMPDTTASKTFSRWKGPATVVEKKSPQSYIVEINDARQHIHANHLRKFYAQVDEILCDHHAQRVSAKHGVKDDFAFLWEHAIFRHPPNKNPLTDRSEILHN
jgi:transposase InsO family protein